MGKPYLLDIIKIVEGATSADHAKVAAYARHLTERLEADGEKEAAKRLRQILAGSKVSKMELARTGGYGRVGSQCPLPVDSESRLTTAQEDFYEAGSVELFLTADVEKVVQQFLTYFRAADRLIAGGVGVSASLLMYGPPGCGKTQLARFIASELKQPLVTARMDGLISSYLGSTAKNLRLLFEHAMSRPCVLFLDEFDAIAKMRDDAKELGELKRVVIGLLQNIDVMGTDHVLLAATNHEHLLDPAIWRRFAYKVQLREPDAMAREKMLTKFLGTYADESIVRILASLSDGLTGAQLRLIVDNCIRDAILSEENSISLRHAIAYVLSAKGGPAESTDDFQVQLRTLRNSDPKTFTQQRLAGIFGVSQGQVSKLLRDPDL
jgi:SpoVK/Ycf46/Vps4 family AAA+-type ATPase